MKKLNTSQKLEIYRLALSDFRGNFLCSLITVRFMRLYHTIYEESKDAHGYSNIIEKMFPELYKYRPFGAGVFDTWFGDKVQGWNRRVEVLTEIIRKLERRERILKFFKL